MRIATLSTKRSTAPDARSVPQHGRTAVRQPRGHTARWWRAVLAGAALSVPSGWLLSYAAALPFFLGVFFFLLFGLMIGAAMHRVAAPGRPYPWPELLIGTTLAVLVGGAFSIVKEARDFPADAAARLARQTRTLGPYSAPQFRRTVERDVRRFLREQYTPGGVVGYVRFVLTGAPAQDVELAGATRPLDPPQRGAVWLIRVVLSFSLLAFGIGSQTFLLRKSADPALRAIDEKNAPEA